VQVVPVGEVVGPQRGQHGEPAPRWHREHEREHLERAAIGPARMSSARSPLCGTLRALIPATLGGASATVSVSTDCAAAVEYSGTSTAAAFATVESMTTRIDRPTRDRMPRSVTTRPDTASPPGT
jgi:hypothetical protein